ncbi:hypothetical protein T439DRAFT_360752 [Meredithblackwellia eburnea MCA 4105]
MSQQQPYFPLRRRGGEGTVTSSDSTGDLHNKKSGGHPHLSKVAAGIPLELQIKINNNVDIKTLLRALNKEEKRPFMFPAVIGAIRNKCKGRTLCLDAAHHGLVETFVRFVAPQVNTLTHIKVSSYPEMALAILRTHNKVTLASPFQLLVALTFADMTITEPVTFEGIPNLQFLHLEAFHCTKQISVIPAHLDLIDSNYAFLDNLYASILFLSDSHAKPLLTLCAGLKICCHNRNAAGFGDSDKKMVPLILALAHKTGVSTLLISFGADSAIVPDIQQLPVVGEFGTPGIVVTSLCLKIMVEYTGKGSISKIITLLASTLCHLTLVTDKAPETIVQELTARDFREEHTLERLNLVGDLKQFPKEAGLPQNVDVGSDLTTKYFPWVHIIIKSKEQLCREGVKEFKEANEEFPAVH